MAVNETGAIFKALTFDGESSRDYGVYITGQAVYNAPERDVEMVTIPGRNGAFAQDQGRFENIEVTYPAGMFASNQADFAQGIAAFRNMLCSRKGYCRLTDEYNPNEYRLAVYKSGLEVDPTRSAGEFNITFECKPQRYLMSGERVFHVGDWNDTDIETGDLVTVDDTAGSNGIKSLNVSFAPTQDGTPQLKDTLYKTPYLFRAVPESDDISGVLPTLVGASGVVNQLEQFNRASGTVNGVSFTNNNDGSFTLTNTATSAAPIQPTNLSSSKPIINGHIYLGYSNIANPSQNGVSLGIYVGGVVKALPFKNYAFYTSATDTGNIQIGYRVASGYNPNGMKIYGGLTDLTQFFGSSAIPDRAYALEQNQAGSGIAWLKSFGFFTKPYYAYNTGTMQSVKVSKYKSVGFNQLNPEDATISGSYNASVGDTLTTTASILTTSGDNPVVVNVSSSWRSLTFESEQLVAGDPYKAEFTMSGSVSGNDIRATAYLVDTDYNVIAKIANMQSGGSYSYSFTPSTSGLRFALYVSSTSAQNVSISDFCVHLVYDGSRDGEYEQYNAHEYTIDDEELRGIYKYDSVHDTIYADGDVYPADGTVTRRYGSVDLGTLTWYYTTTQWGEYPTFFASYNGKPSASGAVGNLVCPKYTAVSANALYVGVDKSMADNNTIIRIRDTAYTDAATFKTAMDGVYLVYELATPTTEEADPYNTPFICDNWGTEEWVDTRTVPMPAGSVERFGTFCEVRKTDELNTHVSPNLCDPDKLLNGYCYRQGDGTLMESATKVALPKLRLYGRDKIAISFDKTVQNTRVNWIVFNENGQKLYWDSQNTADSGWYISDDRVGKVLSFNYNVYPTAYAVGFYFDAAGVTVVDTLSDIMLTFTNTVVDYIAYGEDLDTDLGQDVYGGTFGLLDGTGTSDYGMVDMGSLTFTVDYNQDSVRVFGATLSDMEEATNTIMCVSGLYSDGYKQSTTSPWSGLNWMENNSIARKQDKVYVRDDGYNDADDFKYAVSGMHLIYKKKTPAAVTFTAEAPTLAHTVNYIWNDEGTVTVEYGTDPSMIVNPTLFGCSPLIETEGYGTLSFNGYSITLANATMGNVILGENVRDKIDFSAGIANAGDTITVDASTNALLKPIGITSLTSESVTSQPSKGTASIDPLSPHSVLLVGKIDNIVDTFTYGTSATKTYTATYSISYAKGGIAKTCTITMVAKLVYSATHNTISFSVSVTSSQSADWTRDGSVCTINEASVYSTLSILGNPTYIDCDLGECYRIESGDIVSLDKYVDLGSDLPELVSGINSFTSSNTFTKIDVQPRWWTV